MQPTHRGAGKSEAEENRRIHYRSDALSEKWGLPPRGLPQFIKHRHVEKLRHEECGPRGERNTQRRHHDRASEPDRKADQSDTTSLGCTENPVTYIGDEVGPRIEKRAPSEPCIDRVLHQNIGDKNDARHRERRRNKLS